MSFQFLYLQRGLSRKNGNVNNSQLSLIHLPLGSLLNNVAKTIEKVGSTINTRITKISRQQTSVKICVGTLVLSYN